MMNRPHGKNLRKGRVSIPGQIYFLTTVVYQRRPVFHDLYAGRILVNAMRYHHDKEHVRSFAYVIMPDHLHWLIQLNQIELPTLMASVKGYSARHINQYLGIENQIFWQEGYHDHALRQEEDIKTIARYLVANPLRAGLVIHVNDYSLWDAIWL